MGRANAMFRSHEWRWHRIEELAKKGKAGTTDDEPIIRDGVKCYKKLSSFDPAARFRLDEEFPAISCAHRLWSQCRITKYYLEAAVLSDVPREEIAEMIGATVEVVETYELLFFDVRDRLKNKALLMDLVLAPATEHGVNDGDPDQFWKLLSLHHGWEIAKAFIHHGEVSPRVIDQMNVMMAMDYGRSMARALKTTRMTSRTAVDFLGVALNFKRMEHEQGSAVSSRHDNAVKKLLQNVRTTITSAKRLALPPAAEPRLQEPRPEGIFHRVRTEQAQEQERDREQAQ